MTFKLSIIFFCFLCLICSASFNLPHKCLKTPLANSSTPIQASRHESLICTTRGKLCGCSTQLYPKSMSQTDFTFFKRRGIFLSPFFFLLSAAAACSQGLVASVWWCNAVTVLLQSSRKASATAFRTTPASNKDTYTARRQSGHRRLSGLTERRRAEAKGGERKCHVLVMKYRTAVGSGPKPIWLHVSHG